MKQQLEGFLALARSALRFRWQALLVTALIAVLGAAGVLAIPGKYESRAQIYVDTKSVLRPLLAGVAVADQNPEAADVVRRALLARPALEKVVRETGLSNRAATAADHDQLILKLQADIAVNGDSATGLYNITYDDYSPRIAQAVVKTLLDAFVTTSIDAGRSDTRNAQAFLEQQVAEYERRLSASEQRIADFKKKNIGLMPDQRGDSFARLQSETSNRDKLQADLAVAVGQRDALRRKISSDASASSTVQAAVPTNAQIRAAETLDSRIREARSALDVLLDKYTEEHPQVVAQKEMIERLERQRQQEFGGVRLTNATRSDTSPVASDPVVQNLQIALNDADVRVETLGTQLAQSQAQIAQLRQTMTTGPEIEAELARLNRDYGVTKTEYETLLQRLESARISSDADRSAEQRFKVLEAPLVALRPVKPDKPLLLGAVLVVALAAGAAFAVLRAQTQPVFFSRAAVSTALGLPVVGVVSRAETKRQAARRHRHAFAYLSALAALVVLIVGASAFSLFGNGGQ
jgi:polysaccharide chain length determinant protein (PEP-CTERM system associated)